METSIGGMLIIGVLLAAVMLMSRAFIVSNTVLGTAMREAAEVSGERARTVINIENATSTGGGLTVELNNTGSTSVSDYEHMDFIVKYQENPSGDWQIKRLTYIDEWTNGTPTPDTYQPGIWDPGEIITLEAQISPPHDTSTPWTIHVATPNGVTAVGNYAAP